MTHIDALAMHELCKLESFQATLVLLVKPSGEAWNDFAVKTLSGFHNFAVMDFLVMLAKARESIR